MATTRPGHIQGGPAPSAGDVPLLLSVPEAARLLGVGVSFGWMLVRNGAVPSVRLGRRVLVLRVALERLAGTVVGGTAEQTPVGALLGGQLAPGQRDDSRLQQDGRTARDDNP